MKILLTTLNSKYVHSNLALKYLYTVSIAENPGLRLREFTINNDLGFIYSEILAGNFDVVCFSTYIWNVEMTKLLIRDLKTARPDLIICLGGPEVSYRATEFLRENEGADFIITGEGEYSFYRFCQVISSEEKRFDTIPGFAYRENGEIISNREIEPMDMNLIPFPYSILESEDDRVVYYESTRGCPFRCSYCLSSIDKSVRALNVERVKSEIGYFLRKKVMQVKFIDRTFNYDKKRAYTIFKYIMDNDNYHTSFHMELCADLIDEDTFELLSKARKGLFELEIGIQSTNPKTLKSINRSENVFPVLENVERLTKMGNLHVHVDLIAGLPYETYDIFTKSFNRVYLLNADQFQLGFLKVLKGTPMEELIEEFEIRYQNHAPYEVISTRDISSIEIVKLKRIEEMVDIFYNRGGFEKSVPFLMKKYSNHIRTSSDDDHAALNPFKFYEALADFYYRGGFQNRDRKKDDNYRILMKFLSSVGFSTMTEAEGAALIEKDAMSYMDELNFKRFLNKGWNI